MPESSSPRLSRALLACLLAVALVRLCTLGTPALLDSTEGRYGAMALKMLDSGDWVTPQIPWDHGFEPYLGKPPLHFWLMAASLAVLGKNEWAARMPSFLMALLMLWTTVSHARLRFGKTTALLSASVLCTTGLFFFGAGTVNVDITLAAFVNLAVVAFCRVGDDRPHHRRTWGYLFFLGLGLGFLTKGPVAIALVGLAGIMHLVVFRNWRIVTRLPWIVGPLLFLAIVVPWFWIAQLRNPDLLRYFFVNENLDRFTSSDYGDRYGTGRAHFFGATWLFTIVGSVPWVALPLAALSTRSWRTRAFAARRSEGAFLLLWALSPALLFTPAPQFTIGYLLPGCGALAIFVAHLIEVRAGAPSQRIVRTIRGIAVAAVVLAVVVIGVGWFFLSVSPLRGAAVLGVVLVFAALVRHLLRKTGDVAATAAAGVLATAGCFFAVIVVSAPYASGSKSVEPLFARFLAAAPAGRHTIGLAYGHHFSAYFYGPAWTGDAVQWLRLDAPEIEGTELHDLFIRTDDVPGLPAAMRQRYVVRDQIGNWAWLTRK